MEGIRYARTKSPFGSVVKDGISGGAWDVKWKNYMYGGV